LGGIAPDFGAAFLWRVFSAGFGSAVDRAGRAAAATHGWSHHLLDRETGSGRCETLLSSLLTENPKMAQGEFEKAAAEHQARGLIRELFGLLAETKKWWLAPILIVMLLLGVLILLSNTAAAPFIYTLF
jgi:hypothetical protein